MAHVGLPGVGGALAAWDGGGGEGEGLRFIPLGSCFISGLVNLR